MKKVPVWLVFLSMASLSGCQQTPEQLKKRLAYELYQEKNVEATKTLEEMEKRAISLKGSYQIHDSSRYGKVEAVKLLIKFGCDVNEKDKEGRTPLHLAAERSTAVVSLLLRSGADVELTDRFNSTPLDLAVSFEQAEAVSLLLAKGATIKPRCPGGSALHIAANRGNCEILAELLKHPHEIDERSEFGVTPLEEAVFNQKKEAVALLRANKARMTLPAAVVLKDYGFVETELKCQPDLVRWKRHTGETLLHLACKGGDERILKFLLSIRTDPTLADLSGDYPFHKAARYGFLSALPLLKSPKIIDARNNWGETPLHLAARHNHREVVEYLIREKCNVNSRDDTGEAILLSVCKSNTTSLAQLLLDKGADPNCSERDTLMTPLHWACRNNNLLLVNALLRAGALPTRDRNKEAPMQMTKDPAILKALQEH